MVKFGDNVDTGPAKKPSKPDLVESESVDLGGGWLVQYAGRTPALNKNSARAFARTVLDDTDETGHVRPWAVRGEVSWGASLEPHHLRHLASPRPTSRPHARTRTRRCRTRTRARPARAWTWCRAACA